MQPTPQAFGEAIDAYGKETRDVLLRLHVVRSMAPPGLIFRPTFNGGALNVHLKDEPSQSFALFFLRQPRARVHDPALAALALAAIGGIAAHLETLAATPAKDGDPLRPGEFGKAIEAGYTVNPAQNGSWQWNHDDSGNGSAGYSTERSAWRAADNMRMFGMVRAPQ